MAEYNWIFVQGNDKNRSIFFFLCEGAVIRNKFKSSQLDFAMCHEKAKRLKGCVVAPTISDYIKQSNYNAIAIREKRKLKQTIPVLKLSEFNKKYKRPKTKNKQTGF